MLKKIAPLLILVMALATGNAYACAVLERADPKVGGEVASADHVALKFSGRIYVESSTLDVTDAQGNSVADGKPYGGSDDSAFMTIRLKPLAPGKYKVKWSVLCDCKSHTPGDYRFTVTGKN